MIVGLLTRNALLEASLSRACAGCTVVTARESYELERILEATAVDVLIIEPRDSRGDCTDSLVRRLRASDASVTIAVYCALEPGATRDLVEIIKVGADEVILRGIDDPGVWLRRRLSVIDSQRIPAQLFGRISQNLPESLRPIVSYCLHEASRVPTVEAAARALGIHRRTLVNRFAASGLPAPHTLIAWCRLLVALETLERSRQSLEYVALSQGFGSAAAFRKMCRRYTGVRIGELRALGGAGYALGLFKGFVDAPPMRRESDKWDAATTTAVEVAPHHDAASAMMRR